MQKLLVFAHFPEAESFIQELGMKKAKNSKLNLFEAPEYLLLITGEGPLKAILALATLLANPQYKISTISNFGVAGRLDPRLPLDTVLPIGTVYGVHEGQPHFHSMELDPSAKWDVVTSNKRIQSTSAKNQLAPMAHIVDCELWGLAQAAQYQGKQLKAYKILSDDADEKLVCQDIRLKSSWYSMELYKYFTSLEEIVSPLPPQRDSQLPPFVKREEFHFTVSQNRELVSLWENLLLKSGLNSEDLEKTIDLKPLLEEKVTKKERSKKLLKNLREQLSPWMREWNHKINRSLEHAPQGPLSFGHSMKNDFPILKIDGELRNAKEWQKMQEQLRLFPFNEILDQFEGPQ